MADGDLGSLGTLLGGENRRPEWLPGATPPPPNSQTPPPPPDRPRSSNIGRPGPYGLQTGSRGGGGGDLWNGRLGCVRVWVMRSIGLARVMSQHHRSRPEGSRGTGSTVKSPGSR